MKNELIKRIGIFVCLLIAVNCLSAGNFPVEMRIDPSTGAISELTLKGDNRSMNWVVKTDGTQYPWVRITMVGDWDTLRWLKEGKL